MLDLPVVLDQPHQVHHMVARLSTPTWADPSDRSVRATFPNAQPLALCNV